MTQTFTTTVELPEPPPVRSSALLGVPTRILSLGAGVQSSTLALMAATGETEHRPDAAIFADTQAEPLPYLGHNVMRRALRRMKESPNYQRRERPTDNLAEEVRPYWIWGELFRH